MDFNFVSINVIAGLRDVDKRLGFLQWLSHLVPTELCLHCLSSSELLPWFSSYDYFCAASFASTHSCGVVVLYRPILYCRSVVTEFDGRFVLVEFGLSDSVFRICCVYDPDPKPQPGVLFGRVKDCVDSSVPTFLFGDFNTVFDLVLDRRGSCPFDVSRESSETLSSLFVDCCVIDIWCTLHPNSSCFSWFNREDSLTLGIDFLTTRFSPLLFLFPPSSPQAPVCGS